MKKNRTKQIVIIAFTFLVMALAVYAVFTRKTLTQDETMENIEKGMIGKIK